MVQLALKTQEAAGKKLKALKVKKIKKALAKGAKGVCRMDSVLDKIAEWKIMVEEDTEENEEEGNNINTNMWKHA